MLYEFVQPSDCITFEAENDDIAKAVCIYVGNGHCFLKNESGEMLSGTCHLFDEFTPEELKVLEDVIDNKDMRFVDALKSFACCSFEDREIYKEITKNYTNQDKINVWHDKHRTSLTDWAAYARKEAEFFDGLWRI